MNKRYIARDVDGIVLLNKPFGISSNAALQQIKHLYQARKAGHTGSLDNLATGLLPVCLGEATKFSSFLLDADKAYRAECTLGATTTTADAEGEVLSTASTEGITLEKIMAVLPQFTGEILQVPPMYSALKQQGQTLYKLARQGKTVERAARPVTIYSIEVESLVENRLTLQVSCSKGTYIRTLAEDIGHALGCGAFISALHRVRVGDYQNMFTYPSLVELGTQGGLPALDALLIPIAEALPRFPEIHLNETMSTALKQGQVVILPKAAPEGLVRLFDAEANFFGLGEYHAAGKLTVKRLLQQA